MNFNEELALRSEQAEEIIKSFVPCSEVFDQELVEAMNYSILSGGKRLRPILIQSFFKMFNGSGEVVYPFMAAMEMLHTYSLVHDDLPAIDNDDFRRGRYTTHKQYGEAMGILAGDALLHQAYETAIKAFYYTDDTDRVIRALQIFGEKTGIKGMLGGQTADVINTGKEIDDELMYYIYEKKTGALIEGSMMIGVALAGADDKTLMEIEKAGAAMGLVFQIEDDILDIYGDEKILGKPVNSDEKNNKKTYVSVNGLEKSKDDIIRFTGIANSVIINISKNADEREFILELFKFFGHRNK